MAIALVNYTGTGAADNPFTPDILGSWSAIDLRPDPKVASGKAFVSAQNIPVGAVILGDTLDSPMNGRTRRDAGTALGTSISATTPRAMLAELLVDQAINGIFPVKPVEPSRRPDGKLARRIFLDGVLAWEQIIEGGPGAMFSESFNQPDSTILGPDRVWEERSGDWATAGNELVPPGAAGVAYITDVPATGDQYAEIWIRVDATGRLAPIVRGHTTDATYYTGEAFRSLLGRNHRLIKTVVGTATVLASVAGSAPPKDVRVEANGSEISMLADGVVVAGPVTDTAIAASDTAQRRVGIETSVGAGSWRADDFEAGDLFATAYLITSTGDSITSGSLAVLKTNLISSEGVSPTSGDADILINRLIDGSGISISEGQADFISSLVMDASGDSFSSGSVTPTLQLLVSADGQSSSTGLASADILHSVSSQGDALSAGNMAALNLLNAAAAGQAISDGSLEGLLIMQVISSGDSVSSGIFDPIKSNLLEAVGASATSGLLDPIKTNLALASGDGVTSGQALTEMLYSAVLDGIALSGGSAATVGAVVLSADGIAVSAGSLESLMNRLVGASATTLSTGSAQAALLLMGGAAGDSVSSGVADSKILHQASLDSLAVSSGALSVVQLQSPQITATGLSLSTGILTPSLIRSISGLGSSDSTGDMMALIPALAITASGLAVSLGSIILLGYLNGYLYGFNGAKWVKIQKWDGVAWTDINLVEEWSGESWNAIK